MPITRAAKKALRVSKKKKLVNDRRTKTMKESVKKVGKLVKEKSGDTQKNLALAFQAIDKAMKKGVIKKNTASRKKSRLAKMVNKNK